MMKIKGKKANFRISKGKPKKHLLDTVAKGFL